MKIKIPNEATKQHAIDVLQQIRKHVLRNGVTGGNPTYREDIQVCPRGLTYHFAKAKGFDDRLYCTATPRDGSVAEAVCWALDSATQGESGDLYSEGGRAEASWSALNSNSRDGGRRAGVQMVDTAIRLLEFYEIEEGPQTPLTPEGRLEAMFAQQPLAGSIMRLTAGESHEILRDIRRIVSEMGHIDEGLER